MNDLTASKVLVIGGAGFVGSHIVDQLLNEGVAEVVVLDSFVRGSRENLAKAAQDPRVTVVEGSVEDRELLAEVMEQADYAFHLAALWLFECIDEPRLALEQNVVGTYNVVEAARSASVKRVVYSSSAIVYGDALFTPITEEHPLNNRTMYGATKIAGEQFFRANFEQHGMDYVGLRYMNIYGPRMDYRGPYINVIAKMLNNLDEGKPPVVFGDGSQAYDFVNVEDVARCNILAMKSEATDKNYNVGTGVKTTIQELVDALLDITGSDIEPEYKPQAQMLVSHRVGSVEAARVDFGFEASVPFREGLESLVAWREADQQAREAATSP